MCRGLFFLSTGNPVVNNTNVVANLSKPRSSGDDRPRGNKPTGESVAEALSTTGTMP